MTSKDGRADSSPVFILGIFGDKVKIAPKCSKIILRTCLHLQRKQETERKTKMEQTEQQPIAQAIMKRLDNIEKLTLISAKQMLTVEEACFFTGLSSRFLYKLTHQNVLPYSKPNGKKIYFDKGDLTEWMRKNHISSREEAEQEAATYTITGRHKKAMEG